MSLNRKRVPYDEGDWIAVLFNNGQYGIARIARAKPPVCFGYFYKFRLESIPDLADLEIVPSGRSDLAGKVRQCVPCRGGMANSRAFNKASWESDRSDWPMPEFNLYLELVNTFVLRTYADFDPGQMVQEVITTPEKARLHPKDGLAGSDALKRIWEQKLRNS